ncbi:MAG: hypothetical protein JWN48_1839 [Myxococcaceae bacterium]|nr:hypothetical protein [Myxococcaceae bacterium]
MTHPPLTANTTRMRQPLTPRSLKPGRSSGRALRHRLTMLVILTALGSFGCAADQADQEADLVSVSEQALNGPILCTIQTVNGHFLTAVGGGGRTFDVVHTDATRVGSWERFTLIDSGDGASNIHYGVETTNGHFLTAVGGGGRSTDVLHSDATQILGWEKFTMVSLGGGYYAIQTTNGHYLTATGGGGKTSDAIHSDATVIGAWEKFRLACQ